MHDGILTARDDAVIPRVEIAVKLITGSTGHRTNEEVQDPERRDFLGNVRSTRLMSASSRLHLDNALNRIDETHNDANFEDGDFLALKPNNDRREDAHQRNVSGPLSLRHHSWGIFHDNRGR